MDKLQHNVGIAETGMQKKDMDEAVRNQRHDHQNISNDQLNKKQRAGKQSNVAPNYSQFISNASVGHVHDNAMGNLAAMPREQIQGDTIKIFGFQREQNQIHETRNGGKLQQSQKGKNGDRNTYHRELPEISSNFNKKTQKSIITTKILSLPDQMIPPPLKFFLLASRNNS